MELGVGIVNITSREVNILPWNLRPRSFRTRHDIKSLYRGLYTTGRERSICRMRDFQDIHYEGSQTAHTALYCNDYFTAAGNLYP